MAHGNHKTIITDNLPELVDTIGVIGAKGMTWDYLVKAGVLPDGDRRYIEQTNPAERDQVRELLRLLCRSPREDYEKFLEVLTKTGQKEVLKILGEESRLPEKGEEKEDAEIPTSAKTQMTPHQGNSISQEEVRAKRLDKMDAVKGREMKISGEGDPQAMETVTEECVSPQK